MEFGRSTEIGRIDRWLLFSLYNKIMGDKKAMTLRVAIAFKF
jgi:hypothetical protein